MKHVVVVFGTRPEAVKMAPILLELGRRPGWFKVTPVATAQHRRMLDQILELFGVRPAYDLNLMAPGQDLFDITAGVLRGMKDVLRREAPDLVLVQGDTTTAMAAALAAFYCRIPVGHVEAGLRTFEKYSPYPEEVNRVLVGHIADWHFAPTTGARENLLREGIAGARVHVTGNTGIDAVLQVVGRLRDEPELGAAARRQFAFLDPGRKLILVTGHRRENFGAGFEGICEAIAGIARGRGDVQVVYPVHLNPNVVEPVHRVLEGIGNVHLLEPLDYLSFVYLMERAHLLLTDSGGVQEEAPSLGKPVLVMREVTERPEAVAAGTAILVGTDPQKISREVARLLDDQDAYRGMARVANPFGDGHAAERIVDVLWRTRGGGEP